MPPSVSDSKGKMVGFDSPERASAYFLEVLLRLQPYAQAVMIDRSYAPDCSYTHPLFHVPPVDLCGLTLPLTNKLDSREAIKLLFRTKRTLFPQTVWKTEGSGASVSCWPFLGEDVKLTTNELLPSGFDPKSNKVFVLIQHKLNLAFMPKIFNTLQFKVVTTLQLKPIYINLSDETHEIPSRSSGYTSNSPIAAVAHRHHDGDANSQDGIGDAGRAQNGWEMYPCSDIHNQHSGPITCEELQGSVGGATSSAEVKQTAFDRAHNEDLGVHIPLLNGFDGSSSTTENRAGLGKSCCCSADAVCGGSCASCKCNAGSGMVLTTRWVICSQEDMMQPRDLLLCMLYYPAIAVFNWFQAVVYFAQRVKSVLVVREQAKVKAPRPNRSASVCAQPYSPVSEYHAGPSSAAADTKTMETALLPEEYEPVKARGLKEARANIIESMANTSAHVDNPQRKDADIYDSESCFEDEVYDEVMDASYGMRYRKGKLLAEFNNSLQRASGKPKSVRFTDESFGDETGDIDDPKCDVDCKD